jgi:hypothetical protein
MNVTDANETSSFALWYEQRQSIFAFAGLLLFLFVAIVFLCGSVLTIVLVACTECGRAYKKALQERDELVKWKRGEKGDTDVISLAEGCEKFTDLLDPRGKKTWAPHGRSIA